MGTNLSTSHHGGKGQGQSSLVNKYVTIFRTLIFCFDSNGTVKELVFPKALDLDRPKRDRTTFSSRQLSRLEEEFNTNQYIVGKDRTTLAKSLGLSETQVKVWFQNRRTKLKKDNGRKYEGNDTQAESKAARNVLKLLAYQTSVSYPCLQNQLPGGQNPPVEIPISPKFSKLLSGVSTSHTSLHTETRNGSPWSSTEVATQPTNPTIYAYSPKTQSKCLSDVRIQHDSSKRSEDFRPASSSVLHKQDRGIEMVCSKQDAHVELTSPPGNCHNRTQSIDNDDSSTFTYSSGVGSTHFSARGFLETDKDNFASRSQRSSSGDTFYVNDSFNQESNCLLLENKLEQTAAQMIKTSTRETHGCVPLHTVPSHRVQAASWVQGNQSQFVSGPPFVSWNDNVHPPLHGIYGNVGSPNITSTYSNIDQQIYAHYNNYGQPTPNLYADSSGGATPFYPTRVSDHPSFGSSILDPNKYRVGFNVPYYCHGVGINESMKKAIDVNLNKRIGFKLCTLQTPLFGTMGNEHMFNQIQTQFSHPYFNQS